MSRDVRTYPAGAGMESMIIRPGPRDLSFMPAPCLHRRAKLPTKQNLWWIARHSPRSLLPSFLSSLLPSFLPSAEGVDTGPISSCVVEVGANRRFRSMFRSPLIHSLGMGELERMWCRRGRGFGIYQPSYGPSPIVSLMIARVIGVAA